MFTYPMFGTASNPAHEGLLAWLDMEEAAGNTRLDSHTTGNDFAETEGTVNTTTGKIGSLAMNCATSGQSHLSSTSSDFDFGMSDITITGWLAYGGGSVTEALGNRDAGYSSSHGSVPGFTMVIGQFAGGQQWGLGCIVEDVDGNFYYQAGRTAVGIATGYANWWHFIYEIDRTADELRLITNLTTKVTADISAVTGSLTSGTPMIVGNEPATGWLGYLDAVSIWNRILTTDEKTALYNSGTGIQYGDL